MMALATVRFRIRAMLKHSQNKPVNIVMVCHAPSLWNMFDSVYKAAAEDPACAVTVVAMPYRHNSLPDGQYKDDGVFEFLAGKKIIAINGYDKAKDEWLNPARLNPDYVFFQTPYHNFPDAWSVERLSLLARVCYLTYYGTCLFRGSVEETVHPVSFFKYTHLFFMENEVSKKFIVDRFAEEKWFNIENIHLTGHPKLDSLVNKVNVSGKCWKRWQQNNIKRILWTPRWHTTEGTCHFFDYGEFFIDFCNINQNVDFIFRPHPLCLQNFVKTGELSTGDLMKMESCYEKSINMSVDRTGEYVDTFLSSDVLISDISSMLLEYFVTGKPIIYTHRVDMFNEFGKKLSEGFYWVKNVTELNATLEMLLSGDDPLRETRKCLIESLLFMPPGGAGLRIKDVIQTDFHAQSVI